MKKRYRGPMFRYSMKRIKEMTVEGVCGDLEDDYNTKPAAEFEVSVHIPEREGLYYRLSRIMCE